MKVTAVLVAWMLALTATQAIAGPSCELTAEDKRANAELTVDQFD